MIRKKISISMVIIMLFIVLLWSVSGLFHGMQTIDRDGDGLSDKDEEKIGTKQMDRDTDDDGIEDKEEYDLWNNIAEKYSNDDFLPTSDLSNELEPDKNLHIPKIT